MNGTQANDGRFILISKLNGTFVYTDNVIDVPEPPPEVPIDEGGGDGTASQLFFQGAAVLTERTLTTLVPALNRTTSTLSDKMPLDISSLPDPTE